MIGQQSVSGDPDPSSRPGITPRDDPAAVISIDHDAWLTSCSDAEAHCRAAVDAVRSSRRTGGGSAPGTVTIVLTDDARIHDLNRRFREKDKATNVLSFPAAAHPGQEVTELGDVVLGHETVLAEAREAGLPVADHLRHLVVHGCLHLFGYDHEDDADAEEMEALEVGILATLGVSDPYARDREALS